MTKREFGELELAVLRLVRGLQEASVQDVQDRLGEQIRYTTVMTVMSRLAKKGELARRKEGKKYVYSIAERSEGTTQSVLKRVQEKIFGGKKLAMVAYLLDEDEELSKDELDEIEKLIQKMRSRSG